jgi:hypothetical protein
MTPRKKKIQSAALSKQSGGLRMDAIIAQVRPKVNEQQEAAFPKLVTALGYQMNAETGSWRHPAPRPPLWSEISLHFGGEAGVTACAPGHAKCNAWKQLSAWLCGATDAEGPALLAAAAVLGIISLERVHTVRPRRPNKAAELTKLIAFIDSSVSPNATAYETEQTMASKVSAHPETASRPWNATTAAVPGTLDAIAEAVRNHDAVMGDHRLFIGRCLIGAVKLLMGEKDFMDWFSRQRFPFSYETGLRYRYYAIFAAASPVGNLSTGHGQHRRYTRGAAYRLGAANVPDVAREEAWTLIGNGEMITDEFAEKIIEAHRPKSAAKRQPVQSKYVAAIQNAQTAEELLEAGTRVCKSRNRRRLFQPVGTAASTLLRIADDSSNNEIRTTVTMMLRDVLLQLVESGMHEAKNIERRA